MVAVTGTVPVLMALKPGMLPVPFPAMPMLALLLLQLYVVPAVALVKALAATGAPLQTVMLAGVLITGVGLTVMV